MSKLQPHIKLDSVNKICILSGNPDRIKLIASYLDKSEQTSNHRGLVAYKGLTKKNHIPITLLTTGMGGPSTAIVLEEAYQAGGRIFIRIGSCGSLDPNHDIGTIYIPYAAIREEGVSRKIIPLEYPAVADPELYQNMINAATSLNIDYKSGLVWTSDIYYSPDLQRHEKWRKFGANCVEMEVSMLFSYSALKSDLRPIAILTSDGNLNDGIDIYNGDIDGNKTKFENGVKTSIQIVIEMIENLV